MCLAAVYAQNDEKPKDLLLDKVQLIEVDGVEVTCTNLFGQTVSVQGSIKRVDLANSMVTIELSQ
ncbi:MAG: CooT family nickel-binding protein [Coriobacteriales bacterium]